ncbi:MAG TPA: wax ester/triacylglycerol synthase family O-acyltransferase [Marmoricola sp.]|nr:wax ester/triacylglycerol synthase family O-acyltransferase [Marmoricola sp.]HNO38922.1 wax ester/triacylglycerol synthase family O-acyltransferase [Marmoricola sp.]
MVERLRPADVQILNADSRETPMHNATLEIFEPGERPFTYEALIEHVTDRITYAPRYRQRVLRFANLATPVWIDDEDFDVHFHIHRSALPKPGTLDQLRDMTARTMTRRLDPDRPLWQMFFIEGLEGGRVAILSKTHHLLVDGINSIDLGQALFDMDPGPHDRVPDDWQPRPRPPQSKLLGQAVAGSILRPWDATRHALESAQRSVSSTLNVGATLTNLAGAVLDRADRQDSPFNREPSTQRRVEFVRTDLRDYNKVRHAHGGTVHDVVLAVLAGAIRAWYMTRAESVANGRRVRALVPMSMESETEASQIGAEVVGHLVDLPIGEVSPVVRLHQVSYAVRANAERGKAIAAASMARLPGFAPTTFHALGARVAAGHASDGVNLVITNVPGPQFPMYLAGARMTESFPVPTLHPGFSLSIGVTSYDGEVTYGLTGDRDVLADLNLLSQCIGEALEELVESTSGLRTRASRGRKRP